MSEHFFTGGLMPSEQTLLNFRGSLDIEAQWRVPGQHYERTCNAWLARLDQNRVAAGRALEPLFGRETERWLNRWRMFFMACAELFGYRRGSEWFVAHSRFCKPA